MPTQVVENSYIPPPWMVSHSIFSLLILEDQQIDLHPQISSYLSGLVTLPRPSQSWSTNGNSVPFSNQNSLPKKREIHWKCLLVIVGCLVFYAIFYFYPHIEKECSSTQSHDYSLCPFSPPFWKHLPPSLASILWCCMLLWGSGLSSLFLQGCPGPLVLSSLFHWQHLQWLDMTLLYSASCSLSFPPEPLSQPN